MFHRALTCFLVATFFAIPVAGQGVVLTPLEEYNALPTRSGAPAGPSVAQATIKLDRKVSDLPLPDFSVTPDVAMSMQPEFGGGFDNEYTLPSSMDLRDFLPVPGVQEGNSCVAWAIAHAVYSCQISQQRHQHDPHSECDLFSPDFIYENLRPEDDGGLSILPVVNWLKENGCASRATVPINSKSVTDPAAFTEAKTFRPTSPSIQIAQNLQDIKEFIYEGYPVVLVIDLDDAFESDESSPDPYEWSGVRSEDRFGEGKGRYHAITAVGYDDSNNAVLVMNSKGEGWKDGGFCWVSCFDLLIISDRKWCRRAYVIKVKEAAPFNISTNTKSYQLRKDRRVYDSHDNLVTLSLPEWTIDDAVATQNSLFVLRRDQEIYRYRPPGSWAHLNAGPLTDDTIAMMAANQAHPLHVLTDDGDIYTYDENSIDWTLVSVDPAKSPDEVVDLRIVTLSDERRSQQLRATASDGSVYVRQTDATWSLAP